MTNLAAPLSEPPAATSGTANKPSAGLSAEETASRHAMVNAEAARLEADLRQGLDQPPSAQPLNPPPTDPEAAFLAEYERQLLTNGPPPVPPPPGATPTAPVFGLPPGAGGAPPTASSQVLTPGHPTASAMGGINLTPEQFQLWLRTVAAQSVPAPGALPGSLPLLGLDGELPTFSPTPEVARVLAVIEGLSGREVHLIATGKFVPYNLYKLLPDPLRSALNQDDVGGTELRAVGSRIFTKQTGGSLHHYADRMKFLRYWNLYMVSVALLFSHSHPNLPAALAIHTSFLLEWDADGHHWMRIIKYHFLLHLRLVNLGLEATLDGNNWATRNLSLLHSTIYARAPLEATTTTPSHRSTPSGPTSTASASPTSIKLQTCRNWNDPTIPNGGCSGCPRQHRCWWCEQEGHRAFQCKQRAGRELPRAAKRPRTE
ncbi:hypothetical protein BJ508DRAFT_303572 [Ascobolus immersus RN42]|uniref:Uncharacterized protein n=1 Tax=Ascobolus immersus RN42 TaxID=1160509 RepID=A0A3N4IKV5_ASCIM|nr:hypothetical protein BJ508DRAFT_303572 [Ascobolus immersus RN42]